ncbi:MAG TPA: hydrogenase formation protein HypD [Spirochaetia bacterium]|nr:hydrogenase formation protein HypD [Spirochaetia bacterium]
MSDERQLAGELVARIEKSTRSIGRPLALMEVCGTHTVELRRKGIHSLLPEAITLVSGPGCPVCVTPAGYVDNALELAESGQAIIATFGDMLKVPGASGRALSALSGRGLVKLVYSSSELTSIARQSSLPVVFLAVGFETTIPTVVSALLQARDAGVENLFLYTAFKTVTPALRFLLSSPDHGIDGFLLPGHVSVVIGESAYGFLTGSGGRPGVITGFESLDMLLGILLLVRQIEKGESRVENAYPRAVKPGGNPRALAVMANNLEPRNDVWRGLGVIPGGGLGLRPELAHMDAEKRFAIPPAMDAEAPGCICSRVIAGKAQPPQCALFGRRCTPDNPVGPCMVSSEGTCAAYFRYGARR